MVHGPATLRSRAVKTRIVERITIALGDVFLPLHGARPSFIVALWRSPRFCGRCLRGSLVPAVAWHHERTRQAVLGGVHQLNAQCLKNNNLAQCLKNNNLELANLVPGSLAKELQEPHPGSSFASVGRD
jgi:hypothetical protein